jgi:UrcA family protein
MIRPSLSLWLIFLSLAAPAAAEPRHSLMLARVAVGDLDLSSDRGASAMLQRLDGAARELCALTPSALFPANLGRERRCRREAVAAAVARLRTPQLDLAHADWLSTDPSVAPPSLRRR